MPAGVVFTNFRKSSMNSPSVLTLSCTDCSRLLLVPVRNPNPIVANCSPPKCSGSTTSVDIYKRSLAPGKDEEHYVNASKWLTLLWGVIAIMFAAWGTLFENLIQLVNIIGSLFYGAILGVFVVAFYIKWIKGNAVFISALISEAIVIYIYYLDIVPYLWLNLIGCVLVLVIAALLQALLPMNLANKTILNNVSHHGADNIK